LIFNYICGMKSTNLSLNLKFCFLFGVLSLWSWVGFGQILTFDFNGLIGDEVSVSSNLNDSNISSSSITRGSGLVASNNGNRFNATNWNTGNINDAILGDDFMEFTITPNSGFEFSITSIQVNVQRSGTGPRAVTLRSSLDGYSSDLGLGSQNILDNTSTQVFIFTFSQNSSTAVTYRFYLHNAESTGGSGGFEGAGNDIIVTGSTSSIGPTLFAFPSSITGLDYIEGNGPSVAQSFEVSGSNLNGNNVDINVFGFFEISSTESGPYGSSLSLAGFDGTPTTIWVQLQDGQPIGGSSGGVTISGGGATQIIVSFSGQIFPLPTIGWQITAEDTDFVIDFDTTEPEVNIGQFDGSGFSPTPSSGKLNSNALIISGLSDGDLNFGDTNVSGDFARGTSTGGVIDGGIYSFDTSSNNYSLGIQPSSDFTPGDITLQIQNKTGVTVNAVDLSYLVNVFNDQPRGNSFNFSYSTDNITYIDISALDLTSPDAADGSPSWQSNLRETTITGLSIPNNNFFYFKWSGDDVSGSGNRDEFALDDIRIRVNPIIPIITASETSISNLNYDPGNGPSASQSFLVSGENLQGNILASLDPTSDFEISLNDTDFFDQVTVNESGGLVSDVPLYVRLKEGLGVGNYTDAIELSSTNANSQFVQLNGRVKEKVELFITEIANPADIGNAKYVELFNAGVNELDLSTVDYHFAIEFNGGSSLQAFELTGIVPPKSYYLIDSNQNMSFETTYGQSSNLGVSSTFGSGDDSYLLSTSGLNDDDAKDTMYDIYGEIGIDGDSESWLYTNSRIYRNNPTVKTSNIKWDNAEWVIISNPTTPSDMTPGYGDNDYIFNGTDWSTNIYLNTSPDNNTAEPDKNIFINSGTFSLTQDKTIGDLVVRSGATLILEPGIKLTVSGDIVNEGTIIFDSDATGTAVLETLPSTSRVVGNGFEVRRYIPVVQTPIPIRAYRYLSSSVTTPSVANNGSIYENWQQGGLNPGDSGYESGVGTHVTGSTNPSNTLGFDPTPSGNPSMFSWDIVGQGWNSINNTNNTTLSVGDTYAILIRGDRSSPLDTNDQTGPSTTLHTTGQIHVGDFLLDSSSLSTTVNDYNFVGNPYQSQVDLVDLILTSSQDVRQDFVYIWDPNLGSLGGYAVLDIGMASISTVIDFGSTTPATSDANQYLQPQQAFFIETSGPNPQINFTEDTKDNSGLQTAVFSDTPMDFSVLDISLKGSNTLTYDGIRLVYGNSYSNTTDNFDATKLWNNSDNFCIISNASYLSVEKRNIPTNTDVTALGLYNLSLDAYTFEAFYYADDPAFSMFLVDDYTGQTEEILPDTAFSYAFTVDANIPDSVAADRFEIIYDTSTLSTVENDTSVNISVYPNPVDSNAIYISFDPNTIESDLQLELFGLDGRLVSAFEQLDYLSHDQIRLHIDKSLQNGTYLLHVTSQKNKSVKKIIINR